MDRKEIREKIKEIEIHNLGLDKICGVYVKIVNLKIRKNKYIADVIVTEEDKVERYNNCEYPKKGVK